MKTLIPMYKQTGEKRYRETYGLYFEDFEIGDVFEHRPGRTITETDGIWGNLLSMNSQQLHFDLVYASKTEWKRCIVDSTITFSILTGMSVHSVSAKAIANLGWDKVRATYPVFAGDTIYAESKVVAKRESLSRPTQGIVTVETRGFNQDGNQVMVFERTVLVFKRGHSPEAEANY